MRWGLFLLLAACSATTTQPFNHPRADLEFAPNDDDLAMPGSQDLAGADLRVVPLADLSHFTDLAGVDLKSLPDMATFVDMATSMGDLAGTSSCLTLHMTNPGLASGTYTINPASGPLSVYCDMTTDGGGWTVVFVPTNFNYQTATLDYSVPLTNGVWAASTEVLLALRNSTKAIYGDTARFAIPADWKVKAPFQYDMTDLTVSVSINGVASGDFTLKYGTGNFAKFCQDPWTTGIGPWGRICIANTSTPFYDAFDHTSPPVDGCQNSTEQYATQACDANHLFTIAIR